MTTGTLQGKRALVTGASSGLGVDFAKQLAAMGCHLILVARREERLRAVQQEISAAHGVEVEIILMDLAEADAPQRLYDQVRASGKSVDVLINNAGYGLYGAFSDISWEREKNMLNLDILTVVHLTKLFAQEMVARNFGYILQVASIGAYQPSPLYASYAAAKSFVLHFGEALSYELRDTGVSCTVVSPGVVRTEFLKVSGQQATPYQRATRMESPEVARIALDAMLKRKASVVPGWLNALSVWSNRLMPRRLSAAVAHRLMV